MTTAGGGYSSSPGGDRDACEVELRASMEAEPGGYRYVRVDTGESSVWVYLGETGDYVIVPFSYCSCGFFLRNVKGEVKPCSHLKGLVGTLRAGRYREVKLSPSDAVRILAEALVSGYAFTLRAMLAPRDKDVGGGDYG